MEIDRGKTIVRKLRIALPAGAEQPVLDIAARIGLVQRPEMVGGGDALSELVERRIAQHLAELWLTEQKALQPGRRSDGDVGQHPKLLEGLEGEVLRLVDDEQGPSAGADMHMHEFLNTRQQRSLRHP